MDQTIALLGGDRRMAVLARLLREEGYSVCTWGLTQFRAAEPVALETAVNADIIVLPVPLSRKEGTLNCVMETIETRTLFSRLRAGQKIYAGAVKPSEWALAQEYGLELTDFFAREELTVRNAVPTAEGAIEAAMANTPITLHGAPCLILGFGRIGKLLAQRLHGLGADVTVSARRLDDLAWIDAFGYRGLHTNRLAGKLGEFRVIFNTVPHLVLSEELLRELRGDCVLIELASQLGFDRAAAEKLGLTCILALGLPGKVAPESAARALKATLIKLWEEET